MGRKINAALAVGLTFGAIETIPGAIHDIEHTLGIGSLAPPTEDFKPQPSWLSHISYPGQIVLAQANSGKEEDIYTSGGALSDVLTFFGSRAADSSIKVPVSATIQVLDKLSAPSSNKPLAPLLPTWELSWYRAPETASSTGAPQYGVEAKVNDSFLEVEATHVHCQLNGPGNPNPNECKGSGGSSAIEKAMPYIIAGSIVLAPEVAGLSLAARVVVGGTIGLLGENLISSSPDKVKTTLAATTAATSAMEHECAPEMATTQNIENGDRKFLRAILQMNEGLAGSNPADQKLRESIAQALKLPLKIVLVNPNGSTNTTGKIPLTFSDPVETNKDLAKEIGGDASVSQSKNSNSCKVIKQSPKLKLPLKAKV